MIDLLKDILGIVVLVAFWWGVWRWSTRSPSKREWM